MLWKRQNFNPSPSITTRLAMVDHASFLPDFQGVAGGVLLDELHGRYWHLREPHFRVAMEVAADKGLSRLVDIVKSVYPEASEKETKAVLVALWKTKLFKECSLKREAPPLRMVVEFAVLNIYYRILLKWRGWRIVARIRLAQQPRTPEPCHRLEAEPNQMVDLMCAVGQLACGIPGVRASCVPIALTVRHMLRRRGHHCYLVIGAAVSPFEPHIWVEYEGHIIDPQETMVSQNRFRECSEICSNKDVQLAYGGHNGYCK